MGRERSPAASDFEHAFPAVQVEQLDDAVQLQRLRGLEIRRVLRPERRGILHRRIEPEGVEVVAEVVVSRDVAPAAAPRVRPHEVTQPIRPSDERGSAHRGAQGLDVARGEAKERDQVRARPVAVDIGLGEADVAAEREPAERPPALDRDRPLQAVRLRRRDEGAAVRENDFQPSAAKPRNQRLEERQSPPVFCARVFLRAEPGNRRLFAPTHDTRRSRPMPNGRDRSHDRPEEWYDRSASDGSPAAAEKGRGLSKPRPRRFRDQDMISPPSTLIVWPVM